MCRVDNKNKASTIELRDTVNEFYILWVFTKWVAAAKFKGTSLGFCAVLGFYQFSRLLFCFWVRVSGPLGWFRKQCSIWFEYFLGLHIFIISRTSVGELR